MSDVGSNYQVFLSFGEPLNLSKGVEFVSSSKCGAINTFIGTVRDTEIRNSQALVNGGNGIPEPIEAICYEAYESLVRKQVADILESTINSPNLATCCGGINNKNNNTRCALVDPNSRAYVAIRVGRVPVKEASIIICVSSTSRTCSHKAVMLLLERVKSQVALWKKIIFADGHEEWADISKSEAYWLKRENLVKSGGSAS